MDDSTYRSTLIDLGFSEEGLFSPATYGSLGIYVTVLSNIAFSQGEFPVYLNATVVSDMDAVYNETMIDSFLEPFGTNAASLGGKDSDVYRDMLISFSLAPVVADEDSGFTFLQVTLTSGKLDDFVDKTEMGLIYSCVTSGLSALNPETIPCNSAKTGKGFPVLLSI